MTRRLLLFDYDGVLADSLPRNLACVRLGPAWQVVPSDELLQELRDSVGAERVFLQYQ